ncbi:MAG: nuclear transport factor 2 family protein [Pseudomonadota bacterium]
MSAKAIVLQHWQAANARDWGHFAAVLAADVVYEVPQTRERVRGSASYLEFFQTWPGNWRAEIVQLIADEQAAVTTIDFVTDQGRETGISFFEVSDGLIIRITDYWPAPYDPPPRMTTRVERY